MNGPQDGGYDDAVSAIRNHIDDLGVWLAIWQARDDGKPDAHARRCASDAVDAVDAMLQALLALRQSLVSEIHQADEANAARVDALLAGRARDQERPGASRPLDAEGRGAEDAPARERNTDE